MIERPGSGTERIEGPERVAVRRPGSPTWFLLASDSVRDGIPFGVRIELERPDVGRRDSSHAQRGLSGGTGEGWRPAVPPRWIFWAAMAGAVTGVVGMAGGAGRPTLAFTGAVTTFAGMAVALAALAATTLTLRVCEAAALGGVLHGDGAWLRFGRGMLRVEPAAWRLGVPVRSAAAGPALAFGAWLAATGWHTTAPAVTAGVAIGSVLYLLQALYPLRAGPGAALLEALTGTRDLPVRLRWALVTRFVPVPTRIDLDTGGSMTLPAVVFAAWASLTGGALYLMAASPATGATMAGRTWQLVFVVGLALYTGWLAWRVLELVLSAALLRPGAALKPIAPPADVEAEWATRNPLTRHLPSLKEARWRWGTAPRGAVLIRYGARERHFLWLAEGLASVVGRTPEGDPELVAELHGGGGVGEIALLEDRPRTADVIAQTTAVVAILDREEFERVTDDVQRARFRELVEASQALGRASALRQLSPDDRGLWLAEGRAQRFAAGETVVREDEIAHWLGLVVRGRLEVSRENARIGGLGPDDVFGEVGWLDSARRNATLTAEEETLVWRWDEDFLDRQVGEGEVPAAIRSLAEVRAT